MFNQFMTEREIVKKVRKISLSLIPPEISDNCTNRAAINSNDNYIHKVSENTLFIFVHLVDLKIFKFKSRELFWDTLHMSDFSSEKYIFFYQTHTFVASEEIQITCQIRQS